MSQNIRLSPPPALFGNRDWYFMFQDLSDILYLGLHVFQKRAEHLIHVRKMCFEFSRSALNRWHVGMRICFEFNRLALYRRGMMWSHELKHRY